MTFWTDTSGKQLTRKEFMERWKSGLKGITPLQQTKMQMNSTWIMLVGILCGIVVAIIAFKTIWWLLIILVGALFNTSIQQLGIWQKKKLLEQFEISLEGGRE